MRKVLVKTHNEEAGILIENDDGSYCFEYLGLYDGPAISLTLPVQPDPYVFDSFPSFFDGLLPEGTQLEGLLKIKKIDKQDYFSQLIATGQDLVGAVTVHQIAMENE